MAQNLEALRQAAVIYPTIAILFTLPYLAWSYRRYGSVFSLRILIVYSFILYMLCVYCLVILPLPHGDAANKLHGHPMQLIPLDFVRDMIRQAGQGAGKHREPAEDLPRHGRRFGRHDR